MILIEPHVSLTNQGKLFKHTWKCFVCLFTLINFFVKSLPWPLNIHGSKIYFYRNIVRQNVSYEKGLRTDKNVLFSFRLE